MNWWINTTLVSVSLMLSIACAAQAETSDKKLKQSTPNVVLFLSDDTNWFDIEPYDRLYDYTPHNAITPNLMKFAQEGMLFTSAFTSTALCSPTRQQLYTGLFPVRNGAYPQHSVANKGTKSVVHYFEELGYRVALAGKRHIEPESVYPFEFVGKDIRGTEGTTTFGIEGVEEFIKRDKDQPFFLIIASNNSHGPWTRGDRSLYDADKLNIPPFLVDSPGFRKSLVNYYAEITDLDTEFGLVDDVLERNNLQTNTITIFTSEQGGGMPFAKYTTYDAGLKTAFMVRWPDKIKAGSVTNAMVQYVDVVPTLIEAAQGNVPNNIDGESFLSILKGLKKEHREYSYGVHTTRNLHAGNDYPIRSVRSKRYKLILNLMHESEFNNLTTLALQEQRGPLWEWQQLGEKGDQWAKTRVDYYVRRPAVEFYDVINDPFETENLADHKKYRPLIAEHRAELARWMKQQGDLGIKTELDACQHAASFKACP
ncbi:MAG: sulfatase [Colwellia sp.]|nr:sulfatase [Colwellia sp.]